MFPIIESAFFFDCGPSGVFKSQYRVDEIIFEALSQGKLLPL
jgi:hypothetical protein